MLKSLSLLAALVLAAAPALAADWTNVTNNVGGDKWGSYGVCYVTSVPGSDAMIAGVSEVGLWASTDNGTTWKKMGGNEIKFRPGCIVFDPKNTKNFWVSGCYGDSPFATTDGGATFHRLGKLAHSDTIAVDFGDPERKTLLLGLHEQSQSVQLSTDGGVSWTKIGANLPAGTAHSPNPICIDAKTFLVNTCGWQGTGDHGIFRTVDAGKTWEKVYKDGPNGTALVASDGAIYWQRIWGGGLLKSTDQGKTWKQISNAVKSNPIELPGGKLAGYAEKQVLVSADGGAHWNKFGPAIPFNPSGITFSEKGKAFYAWQLSSGDGGKKREAQSIVRLAGE